MATSFSRVHNPAGYKPGQYQKVTFTYQNRVDNTVTIKWTLYAKSLGYDTYSYNTRHNCATFYYNDIGESTKSYQLYGTKTSATYSGYFNIIVDDEDTQNKYDFGYSNARIWVRHTNASDPRSTGVVSRKAYPDKIDFPANAKHIIKFNNTNIHVDTVLPDDCIVYGKKSIELPEIIDNNGYFEFIGWSLTDNNTPSYSPRGLFIGDTDVSVGEEREYNLYACWSPKAIKYQFADNVYKDGHLLTKTTTHMFGDIWNLHSKEYWYKLAGLPYGKPGYSLDYWKCVKNNIEYEQGSQNKEPSHGVVLSQTNPIITYDAVYNKVNSTVIVHSTNEILGNFVNTTYKIDESFNLSQVLYVWNVTSTTLKPGYKLVGWTNSPDEPYLMPNTPIEYNKLVSNKIIYPINYVGPLNYDTFIMKDGIWTLDLWPVYEYYTTCYVYTSKGIDSSLRWKLSLPYVYRNGKWTLSLSYVNTIKGNDTSKKWKL